MGFDDRRSWSNSSRCLGEKRESNLENHLPCVSAIKTYLFSAGWEVRRCINTNHLQKFSWIRKQNQSWKGIKIRNWMMFFKNWQQAWKPIKLKVTSKLLLIFGELSHSWKFYELRHFFEKNNLAMYVTSLKIFIHIDLIRTI